MKLKFLFLSLCSSLLFSQDFNHRDNKIYENSSFLSKTYYSANFGLINYPFSNANLKEGFASSSVSKNRFSGRFLLGYKFSENFGMQYGVMRPATWFMYDNVNNIGYERSVWINVWSLSLKKYFRLNKRLSLFGEFGYANVARVGFDINDEQIYDDAQFGSTIFGAGLQYHINDKWRLALNGVFIPQSTSNNQPEITQASIGFEYHMQPLSEEKLKTYNESSYFFPLNLVQISYGNGELGFDTNRFFSMNAKIGNVEGVGIPIFWEGDVKAQHAFSVSYQRRVLRTLKLFSLDWGISFTAFQTTQNTNVFAVSVYPEIRFFFMRGKNFDFYFNYSVIGPTFLSVRDIDGIETGPNITYQDKMGFGVFFGSNRKYNFEARIMHYSNGNFFVKNAGVDIPFQFTFGRTF